jgi:hypothetical protein
VLIAATSASSLAAIRLKAHICRDIACDDTDLAWPMLCSLMADLLRAPLDDQATLRFIFTELGDVFATAVDARSGGRKP